MHPDRAHPFTLPAGTNREGSGRGTPRTSRREQRSPGANTVLACIREPYGVPAGQNKGGGRQWHAGPLPARAAGGYAGGRDRRPRGSVPRDPAPSPGTGAGNPVDLKQREGEVFGAEFAGPLNSNLDRSFLHPGQPGIFGHLHTTSLFPIRSINYYHKSCVACLNQANPLL